LGEDGGILECCGDMSRKSEFMRLFYYIDITGIKKKMRSVAGREV
jgi:hypothetical protein